VQRDEFEAAGWYLRAAEQGMPLAQRMLGMRYSTGVGVPRDEGLAAFWLEKAAHQGDVPAMNRFSEVYARRHEFGTETEWIMRAAATGDALATYRLSDAYFRGDRWRVGVEQNNAIAYKLLVIAAARFSKEQLKDLTGRDRHGGC
jgi:uncharacterized protein